eukprot:560821-Alexandrium_andersonii.AAC.1
MHAVAQRILAASVVLECRARAQFGARRIAVAHTKMPPVEEPLQRRPSAVQFGPGCPEDVCPQGRRRAGLGHSLSAPPLAPTS